MYCRRRYLDGIRRNPIHAGTVETRDERVA